MFPMTPMKFTSEVTFTENAIPPGPMVPAIPANDADATPVPPNPDSASLAKLLLDIRVSKV